MSLFSGSVKWLVPGMHVKRWVALAFVGLFLFLTGAGVMMQVHRGKPPLVVRAAQALMGRLHAGIRPGTFGMALTVFGGGLCLFGLGKLIHSLTSALDPEMAPGGLVDVIYRRRVLTHGRRIVVIGGGTGLSTMLRGLKQYSGNITAVVTVADDGGSSGKLQKQLHILPPGDIRNCLVALADAETQMTELFQFRFGSTEAAVRAGNGSSAPGYGDGLRDHAFGNLLIAAMAAINEGDFERGVRETSRVLNVRGRVLPSTVTPVRLRAEMEDGEQVYGETAIAHHGSKIRKVYLEPLEEGARICPIQEALQAIQQADVIVLGPGSVFTSILPNLLVPGVPEAIRRSTAKKVYVCNVMTQPGETDGFTARDHIRAIEGHVDTRLFQYVLVNTGMPDALLVEKYRKTGAVIVAADVERIKAEGYRPIASNFINETDVVRHDAGLLAKAIMRLIE